ncbi:MAG TPA: GNAT family N-acetyltransferase [Candidatus Limnocylindrales bacterium]|jgi:acetyltransferase|nr:GNAT family N-acetyltransferase [Candidatus Limnocylindrales bacterium]
MSSESRSPVTVRRVRPSDQSGLRDFYAALSAESRRARFLGLSPGLSEAQSLSFCTPDHMHGEGFVALADDRIVGHLCLEPWGEQALELAVAVADDCQGQGIGRRLFEAAVLWAQQRGALALVASAYADNARVLRLLSSAPHQPVVRGPDAGVVTVTIPLQGPLPKSWRRPEALPAGRSAGRARGPCHVVWRRRRPPVRDAAG